MSEHHFGGDEPMTVAPSANCFVLPFGVSSSHCWNGLLDEWR